MNLVVDVKGEQVSVKVIQKSGSYHVMGEGGSVEVVDNFSLADSVINTSLNGENVVAQLIRREAGGQLRIRYKGTALECVVMPGHAAELQHIMPVKVPSQMNCSSSESPLTLARITRSAISEGSASRL